MKAVDHAVAVLGDQHDAIGRPDAELVSQIHPAVIGQTVKSHGFANLGPFRDNDRFDSIRGSVLAPDHGGDTPPGRPRSPAAVLTRPAFGCAHGSLVHPPFHRSSLVLSGEDDVGTHLAVLTQPLNQALEVGQR